MNITLENFLINFKFKTMPYMSTTIFSLITLVILTGCSDGNLNTSAAENTKTNDIDQAKNNNPVENNVNANKSIEQYAANKIIMNGITWDKKTEEEFQKTYKIKPIPGNYWYDATSGLWGVAGDQASGFIYAGHSYGTLKSDASNGNTNIFINGRNIPMNEALVWGQLMGTPAQTGRYWLDGRGNVGYE
jgi:hypothetical protein